MRLSAYSLALALLFTQLFGCMAVGGKRHTFALTEQDSLRSARPIDPWSLGPDVFAQAEVRPIPTDSTSEQPTNSIEKSILISDTAAVLAAVSAQSVLPRDEQVVPLELEEPQFTVQLGTFLDRARAQEFYDRAVPEMGMQGEIQSDWPFFRLRFGKFISRESADSLQMAAMKHGFYDARVVKLKLQP